MADSKWISELRGEMPLADAARHVLSLRLGLVRERLPLAVAQADDDPEHVHQLRVGTRRAGAALRIFASTLPAKLGRRARRTLRRLRRAAGAARDWDVFQDMLVARLSRAPASQRRGLDLLLGFAQGQRVAAQQHLAETTDADDRLSRLIADIGDTLRSKASARPTLHDLAVPVLTQLLQDLEQTAAGDLRPYEHLHQVRILGKKLRYAMEVFACCFGPEFRERYYPAVEEMQEILGLANDSHVAVGRLERIAQRLRQTQPKLWPEYEPGLDTLIRFHQRRLPKQRTAFERWWRNWHASGVEQAFAALMASP